MAALYQAIAEALLRHWRSIPKDQARCHSGQQLAFWTAAMQHLGSAVRPPLWWLSILGAVLAATHTQPASQLGRITARLNANSCFAVVVARRPRENVFSLRRCLFSEGSSPAAGARCGSSQVPAAAKITDFRS